MIKKLLLTLALCTTVFTPVAALQSVSAVDVINNNGSACNNPNAQGKPSFCADNETNGANPIIGKNGILTRVIGILAKIVGVVSVIVIIISGIRMVISQDANAASQARRGVISAVVGLLIALLAQGLVSFVLSKL